MDCNYNDFNYDNQQLSLHNQHYLEQTTDQFGFHKTICNFNMVNKKKEQQKTNVDDNFMNDDMTIMETFHNNDINEQVAINDNTTTNSSTNFNNQLTGTNIYENANNYPCYALDEPCGSNINNNNAIFKEMTTTTNKAYNYSYYIVDNHHNGQMINKVSPDSKINQYHNNNISSNNYITYKNNDCQESLMTNSNNHNNYNHEDNKYCALFNLVKDNYQQSDRLSCHAEQSSTNIVVEQHNINHIQYNNHHSSNNITLPENDNAVMHNVTNHGNFAQNQSCNLSATYLNNSSSTSMSSLMYPPLKVEKFQSQQKEQQQQQQHILEFQGQQRTGTLSHDAQQPRLPYFYQLQQQLTQSQSKKREHNYSQEEIILYDNKGSNFQQLQFHYQFNKENKQNESQQQPQQQISQALLLAQHKSVSPSQNNKAATDVAAEGDETKQKLILKERNYNNQEAVAAISSKVLDLNLMSKDQKQTVNCDICYRTFTKQSYLRQHKNAVHTNISLKCPKCKHVLHSDRAFKRHMKTHEIGQNQRAQCPHCIKSYCHKADLKVHIRVHHGNYATTTELQLVCDICNRKCARADHLKKHRQIHFKKQRTSTTAKRLRTKM